MYFDYHAKAKKKIIEGKLIRFEIVDKWNNIAPAMVLYFSDSPPMPIREYRWQEYFDLFYELSK